MSYIIFFICSFFLIYMLYEIFVIRKDRALKKMKKSKDMLLLCKIGNIDINKTDLKKLARYLSLTNSFIISMMCTLVLLFNRYIKNFYLWVILSSLIAIVVLIPLIILFYKLIGKIIKKEGR